MGSFSRGTLAALATAAALFVACAGDEPAAPPAVAAEPTAENECPQANRCDGSCVDFDDDVLNCGSCGRTCVIGHAAAACVDGECALASCEDGWADCDGAIDNGCEAAIECQAGDSCATSCGSNGSLNCTDVCQPTCDVPPETCNAVDDDCNGSCDDAALAGCRVAIHRAGGANGHFYTRDAAEAEALGYTIEALAYYYLYDAVAANLRPFFRCSKANGKPFNTTDTACEGLGGGLATLGFIAAEPVCGSSPLYRVFEPVSGDHFYTVSLAERDNAIALYGYQDQGIAGYVWLQPPAPTE
jgi:hypothetical protein